MAEVPDVVLIISRHGHTRHVKGGRRGVTVCNAYDPRRIPDFRLANRVTDEQLPICKQCLGKL